MDSNDRKDASGEPPRHRVRVPGLVGQETGLGDVIARATHAVGIRPCGGCARRAASLNRWLQFSPTGRHK
jgi:hypothetical protein